MGRDTIHENRLWNFRQLIKRLGVNEVARQMGKKNSYITAIGGPNPVRNIGSRIAQQIESTFGLTPGALDQPPPEQAKSEDRLLAAIAEVLSNATDDDKEFVLAMSEWIVKRSIIENKDRKGLTINAKQI